jgi:tRNA pseudouridine55 synthase
VDGLLVINKPPGPTSHDVVARMRRALGERRIGHTGTLDPLASGVLPLVLGRATRLARFLTATDKSYEAVIRLGFATDTADAEGRRIGPIYEGPWPARDAIDRALDPFRGTFLQQPPAFSAKKIGGTRSYKIARKAGRDGHDGQDRQRGQERQEGRTVPAAVSVTAHALEIDAVEADTVTLRVDCSAGFYVRSLAHDLGRRLGTGAHLVALRRTRSGDLAIDRAIDLATAEYDPPRAAAAVVPLSRMLPHLSAVVLTPDGVRRAAQGRDLGPGDLSATLTNGADLESAAAHHERGTPIVRLLDPAGELVAIAEPASAPGILHPSVVLV